MRHGESRMRITDLLVALDRVMRGVEAYRRGAGMSGWTWSPDDDRRACELIAALEALGVLKFEEPANTANRAACEVLERMELGDNKYPGNSFNRWRIGPDASLILERLEAAGFKIVRKEPA